MPPNYKIFLTRASTLNLSKTDNLESLETLLLGKGLGLLAAVFFEADTVARRAALQDTRFGLLFGIDKRGHAAVNIGVQLSPFVVLIVAFHKELSGVFVQGAIGKGLQ